MQHEAAAGIDRAALQHLHALGVFRQLDLVGLGDDLELHQELRKVDAARRPVHHDTHGAVGGMRAHIDHRSLEARIAHHGHRNQELAIEIAALRRIVGRAGRLARTGWLGAKFARFFALRVHPQSTLMFDHILILGRGPVNQPWGHTLTSNSMVHPTLSL
jgi:hypothetical protein